MDLVSVRLPAKGKSKLIKMSNAEHRRLSDQLRQLLMLGLSKKGVDFSEKDFFPTNK